jgi:hypothetical protein
MRVIIAGSRYVDKYHLVEEAVFEAGFDISEVVSGTAHGADQLGEQFAAKRHLRVTRFPAKWYNEGVYDNAAGYKRNELMARYAAGLVDKEGNLLPPSERMAPGALIALHGIDPKTGELTKGTKHMIDLANKYELLVYVKLV